MFFSCCNAVQREFFTGSGDGFSACHALFLAGSKWWNRIASGNKKAGRDGNGKGAAGCDCVYVSEGIYGETDMKIEYIRQLKNSYMRIELEKGLEQTEEEMLSRNSIQGILPFGWQREDEKILLRYDITGKLALDAWLEDKKADDRLWLQLLSGICNTVKQLEKFLLSPEGILLCPETIFCDYKTESVYFCYVPGDEGAFIERLRQLTEYLLTKTDHKNKEAVDFAYGLYEELLKPAYSLLDIQNYIQKHCIRQGEREVTEIFPGIPEQEEEKTPQDGQEKYLRIKAYLLKGIKRGLLGKMCGWIKKKEWKHMKRKHPRSEQITFEREEGAKEEAALTELLSDRGEEWQGRLKYEGADGLSDLYITQFPFLIGSAEDCDGVIQAHGISRHHARMIKKEDVYFLEDLNSTNGTRVEGGLLTYRTKISLKKNALICFANQPYRFL